MNQAMMRKSGLLLLAVLLAAHCLLLTPAGAQTRAFIYQADGWHAPPKDPAAVLDYSIDWSAWLGSDTISTSSWTASPGITATPAGNTSTSTVVWISGGTAGQTYSLTNTITTAGGRTNAVSFKITVNLN